MQAQVIKGGTRLLTAAAGIDVLEIFNGDHMQQESAFRGSAWGDRVRPRRCYSTAVILGKAACGRQITLIPRNVVC
jgi:hypothetical protein